jgi:hypothetical protein
MKLEEIIMRPNKLWIPTMILLYTSSWAMAAGESATTIPDFKQVDADRNGSISPMEATQVPDLVEQFSQADRDQDGRLSREEYATVVPGPKEEERKGAGT